MSAPEQESGHGDSLLASGMRLVMRPARALAGSVGVEQAAEQTVDEILAGPLPEIIGRSIGEHRVIERVVAEASKSDDFAKSIVAALENDRTGQVLQDVLASPAIERLLAGALRPELTDRLLRSPEFERVLRGVLTSPEVRHALTRQSTSLAAEAAAGARQRAMRLDDKIAIRKSPAVPGRYGGFGTRGFGLALDALIVGVTFLVGAALVGLVASLVGHLRPEWLVGALMGSGYLLVATFYFVGFWATAGQTPGMRFMGVRVITRSGSRPGALRSFVRLIGLGLAIIPCFAGFIPALVDERRRALQDFLARTLVVYDERL
jgi:uncharacterized RDD family membrane protein YckC